MADNESFIDLQKETKLPYEEVDYVMKNPEGLTKEGVDYNVKQWGKSNRYAVRKYELMRTRCEKIAQSGKLEDGRTILARNPNGDIWAQWLDGSGNPITEGEYKKLNKK
jgi:hypothetical protein